MVLKYASTPQLYYSGQSRHAVTARFPNDARPVSTLNDYAAVELYDRSGKPHYGWLRRGMGRELGPFKDWKTGSVTWRENGNSVDAVCWRPLQQKR